ncbi:MAG TPA: PUA domain-containing protein, partial [Opitutus sp.]|nr:PUA domain-containing protein [Opitutus sp.]
QVAGEFDAGEIVNIAGPDRTVFARGKVSFDSQEIPRLAGKKGEEVAALYPGRKRLEVVHRNDLVLL